MIRTILGAVGPRARCYRFDRYTVSDSCRSLSAGPDGRIYAAACCEQSPGKSVKVVRYDRARDRLEWLFDAAEAAGDPPDSGRATQCKIHYSFASSPKTGLLYCATHLSGPPTGARPGGPPGDEAAEAESSPIAGRSDGARPCVARPPRIDDTRRTVIPPRAVSLLLHPPQQS